MIDYEQQMLRFIKLSNELKLSSGAQVLYFHLATLARSKFYSNTFKIDNITLCDRANISTEKMRRARKELVAQTLIDYQSGSGSASGEYTIIDLLNSSEEKNKETTSIKLNEAEIDNINRKTRVFEDFSKDKRIMARYIYEILQKAIKNQTAGVFGGYYENAQKFINAKSVVTAPFILKLITLLEEKKDIRDLPSYILTSVSNFVRENKKSILNT